MNKILIIQTASIGDVILATALIESLHDAYPGAAIDFLVKKGNESLFRGHPFLHEVITWDKRSEKYVGFLRIARKTRKIHYDLVVNIQRFFLTGLLTAFSGARETRGFSKNPLSFLFTRSFTHLIGKGKHEVSRNQVLISDLFPEAKLRPRLYPTSADEAVAGKFATGKYYTISPASLWFTKQYPVEKWIELVRLIPGDARVYLLGARADLEICTEIITGSGHPGIISLAGELTLLQSAALMKRAKMNFTNDSAPMHLASAMNAPVAAIYCSTVPEFGFGPLSDDSSVIETGEKLSCRPCGLHGYRACPEKHFHCAFTIRAEQLTEHL
ncbi:MAG: glycosyltransferase family 9 protein [Bacteroidetes bacterium]|nr:glycosyltransferase family 9 protein [Bacteroidota bacterium]